MGDDVLTYLIGVPVPGQDVLVIAPGEHPDSLSITHFRMKASTPQGDVSFWSDEGRDPGGGEAHVS